MHPVLFSFTLSAFLIHGIILTLFIIVGVFTVLSKQKFKGKDILVFCGWWIFIHVVGAVIYYFFPNKVVPIHSYGLMLALSFLLGIWLATVRAKKAGLNPTVIADVGFWVIISAIIGARLYYVILHFEEFRGDLLSIINPFHNGFVGIGGLVMYGGFIGAILASIVFFVVKKLPFMPYADASAPSIALGVLFTRIGCFLNGCCYGSPSAHGISFPPESAAGDFQHQMHATGLYPSQLYESAGGLLMFLIILAAGRLKTFPGFQFHLMGILYSVLRFIVDFSRHYEVNERLAGLSHNQIVCIVFFVIFSGLILKGFLFKDEVAAHNPAPATNGTDRQAPARS